MEGKLCQSLGIREKKKTQKSLLEGLAYSLAEFKVRPRKKNAANL